MFNKLNNNFIDSKILIIDINQNYFFIYFQQIEIGLLKYLFF